MEILEKTRSTEDLQRALSRMLSPEGSLSQLQVSVLLDLYYYTVRFCQAYGFSKEQTSCLISIVRETHVTCLDTPLENVETCYEYFKALLLCHTVHRPPFSVDLFSPQQVLQITNYFLNTYFQHFKLYKYVFTPQVRLDLSLSYEEIIEPEVDTQRDEDPPWHCTEEKLSKEVEQLREQATSKEDLAPKSQSAPAKRGGNNGQKRQSD